MFRHYRLILRQPAINTLPRYSSISIPVPCIFYCFVLWPTNAHNYFTNYHTATCFDTVVSSSDSLQSIPCHVTAVFQMQLSVIQFTIKMFHRGFVQVLILRNLSNIKIVLFTIKWAKIILMLQFSWGPSVWWLYIVCNKYGLFINWCVNDILRICRVYLFNDGLTCKLMLRSCWPSMYWVSAFVSSNCSTDSHYSIQRPKSNTCP